MFKADSQQHPHQKWLVVQQIVTISFGTQWRLGGLMGFAHYILTWPQISTWLIT